MRYSLLLLAFLVSTNVWAALTVVGVHGASNVVQIVNGTTISGYTVYGGLAGTCSSSDTSSTCDSCQLANMSCADKPLCACNSQRIYDGLRLHIDFSRDTSDVGNPAVTITGTDNNSGTITPGTGTGTNGGEVTLPAWSPTSVEINWTDICQYAFGNTCETLATSGQTSGISGQGTITITLYNNTGTVPGGGTTTPTSGASTTITVHVFAPPNDGTGNYDVYKSSNDWGISSFTPFPGDEQVYITGLYHGGTWPTFGYGGTAAQLRVFANTDSVDNAAPSTANLKTNDLEINQTDFDLNKSVFGGLTNGTRYYFRVGVKDNAGNIILYYPSKADADAATGCTSATGTGPNVSCIFSTIPDQTLGLLTKDINCFVATAAYGSSMEPKIQVFRDFRFRVLLQHDWGVWFVKKYYTYGPYAARFIATKPWLRSLSRAVLWPFYGFSLLCLHYGLLSALAVSLILLASLCVLPWYGFRRLSARA